MLKYEINVYHIVKEIFFRDGAQVYRSLKWVHSGLFSRYETSHTHMHTHLQILKQKEFIHDEPFKDRDFILLISVFALPSRKPDT